MVDSPELQQSKDAVRRQLRALRRGLSADLKSAEQASVCRLLSLRVAAEKPLAVASYAALPEELSVDAWHAQWWAAGHPVWLPRVQGPGVMSWHPVTDPNQLAAGAYGIREPRPDIVPAQPLPPRSMLVVPGVGFTAEGWRLGQGGGFYDRLLATHDGSTIGIAFACQRVAELPYGPDDCRVNQVIFSG